MYNSVCIQNCIIDEGKMMADKSANLLNKAIQTFVRMNAIDFKLHAWWFNIKEIWCCQSCER